MAFSFQNWFFTRLPLFYKLEDTYKDDDDRGLLERYLKIFGLELDEELIPKIEEYLAIINPLETDPKYLTTMGFTLGSPPDLWNDPDKYALFLAHIVSVYKIKGTIKSFELMFSILGFLVTVTEYDGNILMDQGYLMDDDHIMDSKCWNCSEYSLTFSSLLNLGAGGSCEDPEFTTVDPVLTDKLLQVIKFLEPVNAHLRYILTGGLACDDVEFCFEELIETERFQKYLMDDGNDMDDDLLMDDYESIGTTSNEFDSCEA